MLHNRYSAILVALLAGGPVLAAAAQPGAPLPSTPASTDTSAPAGDGKALFTEKCAMCHRVMGMGTNLLARRYAPADAMLEDRTNLSAAFVVVAARTGIGNMPRISRGEASDAQLQAIAAYLSKGNP